MKLARPPVGHGTAPVRGAGGVWSQPQRALARCQAQLCGPCGVAVGAKEAGVLVLPIEQCHQFCSVQLGETLGGFG